MATILVVDDEPIARRVMRLGLERAGHSVVEAENGVVALVSLLEAEVDLVVTDLDMPQMDGRELICRLHLDYPDVKIVVVSGRAIADVGRDGLLVTDGFRAERTVAKPFSPIRLNQVVTDVLG